MKGYVYRCYDSEDVLLYIGCTVNVSRRIKAHMRSTKNLASHALGVLLERYEVAEYSTRDEAAEAEKAAIRAEGPLLNRQHGSTSGWLMDYAVRDYMEERGLSIESVGLHNCVTCGLLQAHHMKQPMCVWCREADDAGQLAEWLEGRRLDGAA